MFDRGRIEEIAEKSKVEKWPYPKIFNALKAAGVEYMELLVGLDGLTVVVNPAVALARSRSQAMISALIFLITDSRSASGSSLPMIFIKSSFASA